MSEKPRNPQKQLGIQWHEALEIALIEGCRGPNNSLRVLPNLRVIACNESGNKFEVELRFQSGVHYCGAETSWFLATYFKSWWTQLRDRLFEMTGRVPPPMSMSVFGIIENGARFGEGWSEHDSKAFEYTEGPFRECDGE